MAESQNFDVIELILKLIVLEKTGHDRSLAKAMPISSALLWAGETTVIILFCPIMYLDKKIFFES